MNARFLPPIRSRFFNGQNRITNVPDTSGIIIKSMMKKLTLFFVLTLFATAAMFAQTPGPGPISTIESVVVPVQPYPVTVTVPINVVDFDDVKAVSLRIDYDPAVLQYTGFSHDAVFTGIFLDGSDNVNGSANFAWFGSSAVSLPDGTPIITMEFDYFGGSSAITFNTTLPENCEYADPNDDPYVNTPYEDFFINGFVTDLNATATYTNICDPVNSGEITITAANGTGVYQYSIDDGATWHPATPAAPFTPYTFSNLPYAVYEVKVRDVVSVTTTAPVADIDVAILTPPLHNITQGTFHCFIQDAVDAANPGDVINQVIFPWTFVENVNVDKNVTLNGNVADQTQSVISGGGSGTVLNITADGVILNGWSVLGSGTLAGDAAIHLNDVSNVTIHNNVISGSEVGILVSTAYNAGNTIENNIIDGNTYGMATNLLDPNERAEVGLNYWGDAEGPFQAIYNTCGGGDEVTSMVIFHPWYTTDALAATQTATLPIYNVDKDRWYCTIQDASDHADDAETVQFLLPGNYGHLVFDYAPVTKSLYIENASSGVVTMVGAPSALVVENGMVSFDGIDFTTAADDPTVLLNGGKLVLRNTNVYESTGYANIGVLVTGGELDAGTDVTDPGHNRFLVSGSGIAMENLGGDVDAICNHWGSILYAAIFPVIQGSVNFDPWSDYGFTMCEELTLLNGPITYAPEMIEPCGVSSTVTIPIYVENFRNIDAISLTLDYNPAVLTYTGNQYDNTTFPGMSVLAFNPGTVIIGWFNTNMVASWPDNVPLIELEFTYHGGTSLLEWFDDFGTNSEYQNAYVQWPYIDTPQEDFYIDGSITDLDGTVASTNVICYGTNSGTITITGLCGSGNYEYSIDGGLTWHPNHVFNVYEGTYDVWLRDADYPSIKKHLDPALVILQPSAPLDATADWTKRVRCKGESNGKAMAYPAGGWGGYTYLWSDAAGQTTQEATNLAAGYYTVTVTDSLGCEVVAGTFVIEPTTPFTASVSSTVVSCKGGSNGTITVDAANGWGYYMYSIDNTNYYNYLTSNVITGLPAGSYVVHVFDDERCELFLPVTIDEPVDALAISATMTQPVSCYGYTDGQITASATGGWSALGPYEFSIDNVNWQLSPVFDNLTAGSYDVYVRDYHNCVEQTTVVVTEPAPFTAEITGSTTICSGESATVSVNIVGGNAPFDIELTDGVNNIVETGFTGSTFTFTQTYTASTTWSWVSITDANNCVPVTTGDATITVNPLPEVGFTFKTLAATGTVFEYCAAEEVEVSLSHVWVGTAPFEIEWSVFDGSVTTTYAETGVDLNDVFFSSLLNPGTYVVNIIGITDANGCSPDDYSPYTATVVVLPAAAPGFSFNGTLAETGDAFTYCFDETVEVTLSHIWSGTAPFDVEWTVTEGSVTTTYNATGLGLNDHLYNSTFAPGNYTIQITSIQDANGCGPLNYADYLAYVTVHEEPMISFGFNGVEAGHNATFEFCYDQTVEVTLFEYYGGVSPYSVTYEVNGVTSTVSGLTKGDVISAAQIYTPGVYNIVVTEIVDATGCKASAAFLALAQATVIVNEEPMFSFGFNGMEAAHNATFEFCYSTPVEVTLFAEYGGTGPYSVTYEVNGVTSTVTGLNLGSVIAASQLYAPGIYNIVVTDITDAKGCQASAAFLALAQATITIHEEPMISFGFNGVEAGHNATFEYCYDVPVGVTLYNYYGGTAPYSVTYELNGVPTTVTGLELGDVIAAPQTYPAGVHNIVVTDITDANGCQASAAFLALAQATVTIHPMPEVNFLVNTTVLDYPGNSATVCYYNDIEFRLNNIAQGDAPFNLAWEVFVDGSTVADPSLSGSATGLNAGDLIFAANAPHVPGDYFIQITQLVDNNGCEVSSAALSAYYNAMITISPEPAIEFSFNGTPATTGATFEYCYSDIIEVTVSDVWLGNLPLEVTYTIDDGSVTSTHGPVTITNINDPLFTGSMGAGTYTVQITGIVDGNGCSPADYSPYNAIVNVHTYEISGYYNYPNIFLTPLNNITVELVQGTTTLYTTTTDANGYYHFPAVCRGTYDVLSTTIKPVAGINATDAVQVNNWSVAPTPIERVAFKAGDVLVDGLLDGGDASLILEHFVTFGNPMVWPAYDWVFAKAYDYVAADIGPIAAHPLPQITVSTADVLQDFFGLATGDFNASFVPGPAKSSGNVMVANDGRTIAKAGQTIEIPVTSVDALNASAVSLILNYPADKVEIIDIQMGQNNGDPAHYGTQNGTVRIGWQSMMPLQVAAGDPLMTITVNVLHDLHAGEFASFTLEQDPLNEIAGSDYQPVSLAALNIMKLEGTVDVSELNNDADGLHLSNYPNPFNTSTTFAFNLPVDGMVNLKVYDMVGKLVTELVNSHQPAGMHTVVLNEATLQAGIYMAQITLNTGQGIQSRTIRIVVSK